MVTSEECEIAGILLGIKMAIEHNIHHSACQSHNTVYVLSDSESAIQAVNKLDSSTGISFHNRIKV